MTNDEIFNIARATGSDEETIAGRHPSVQQVLRWFSFEHLANGPARRVSIECGELAGDMIDLIPADDPELTTGLRKLLEAKDCFVRAALAGKAAGE